MLAHIRAFAKSPVAGVLLSLLVVSFAIFGIRDVFKTTGLKDSVVEAGGRDVGAAKFRRVFESYKKQIEQQQQGQPVSVDDMFKANVDGRLADELATEESLAALITKEGVRPSDKLVLDQIAQAKRFFDPITGKFDKKLYETFLSQNGMTASELEGDLRDQTAQAHFSSGLGAGMKAPMAFAALAASYAAENRNLHMFVVGIKAVPAPAQPTDDQIREFMKQNAANLIKPEFRTITLARFSASLLAPSVKVDPAEVEKRFTFEKESLSKPETRNVLQLVAKDGAQAAEAAKRAASGQDLNAIAKALGLPEPLALSQTPRSRIADPKVADAAFSLKAGQTSGAVQGALGWAVVKVLDITPGHDVTLAEVRPQVEAEVRKAAAADKAYDLTKKYDEEHSKGTPLADAARKVGAQIYQLPPFSKDGKGLNGQPLQLPPKLMQQAFALNKGGETEGVEEAAPGEYYAIRVEAVSPAAPLTIEEIRAPVTQRLMQQDMIKRVQAKSEELADKVRKGMTIEAAAASIGAQVQNASLARGNQQAAQALGQEFMAAVFGAKTGQVVTAPTQTGIAVIKLETPAPSPVQLVAQVAAQQRAAVSASTGQDFSAAVRLAARSVIKPRVDLKRARSAAGGDPTTVVNPGDKASAKPDPAAAKPDPAKAAKPAA